jgi:glycosyltransferase involved in cell wall biosynthesis
MTAGGYNQGTDPDNWMLAKMETRQTISRNPTSTRPRIAYVIPLLHAWSGWATFAAGAIHALSEFVEPVLIVSRADEATARREFPAMERHVLPTVQAEDWNETTASMLRRMVPALAAAHRMPLLRVRLVHSLEVFPAGWIGDTLARAAKVPHVLTAHGTYAMIWKRWPLLDYFYRRILRNAAAVYPISDGTAKKLCASYTADLGSKPVRPVRNGTDAASRVEREVTTERTRPDSPVVLTVGGVKARKGYHSSLRAFGLLQRRFPDARYLVVGRDPEGEYRLQLEEILRANGIRNVEFLGVVDDARLDSLYRQASIFLLLSEEGGRHFEGFGLVYLEAGAYGLPVVGSRSGGIPDAVNEGKSGFLVAPGDAEGAARAMIRLASDRPLSARMGGAGRANAEYFTWRRYAEEQFRQYQSLLNGADVPESRGKGP